MDMAGALRAAIKPSPSTYLYKLGWTEQERLLGDILWLYRVNYQEQRRWRGLARGWNTRENHSTRGWAVRAGHRKNAIESHLYFPSSRRYHPR